MIETMNKEEVESMMAMLLKQAKEIRESHGYSGDEKMVPAAFIFGEETTIMMLGWKNNKEKYLMAAAANARARETKARSLSFVTDARWVNLATFCEYFRLDAPNGKNVDRLTSDYHRILQAHGGEMKNLPREVWEETIAVFTNGPGIPTTLQIAPYKEGPNDTIEWLPRPKEPGERGKSDMLTDWWS